MDIEAWLRAHIAPPHMVTADAALPGRATPVLNPIPVPAGSSLSVRFRASLYTPLGFKSAFVGTDVNDVFITGNTLSFLSLPTPI